MVPRGVTLVFANPPPNPLPQMIVPGDHADCGGGWNSFPVPSGWTALDKTYGPFRPIPVEFSRELL